MVVINMRKGNILTYTLIKLDSISLQRQSNSSLRFVTGFMDGIIKCRVLLETVIFNSNKLPEEFYRDLRLYLIKRKFA